MIHTMTDEDATLWFVDDSPVRMVWGGVRWRVIGAPERLGGRARFLPPLSLHPSAGYEGWRFRGAAEDGTSHLFEVLFDEQGWSVERVLG